MKKIKINLSSQDINNLINKLQNFQKEIGEADTKIVKELSEYGLKEIQQNYANTPYTDGNDDVSFFVTGTNKKKKIGATGSQVLYDEFGTGTEGENAPHPKKGEFGLNPYNSGKTIRQNNNSNGEATSKGIPVGGLYWTYMLNGEKIYTQGIPAGKQVYNAKKAIENEKKNIIKKVVGDALSKL